MSEPVDERAFARYFVCPILIQVHLPNLEDTPGIFRFSQRHLAFKKLQQNFHESEPFGEDYAD